MTNFQSGSQTPIDIGSRLELMVDDYLIARMSGGAEVRLNKPVPQEVVLVTDKPWEGNACGHFTIFQDGDIFRMYYRGLHFVLTEGTLETRRPQVFCYAQSNDGIHWIRPELGLVEYDGSKKNNIILNSEDSSFPITNFVPFKDANPDATPDAKYKAWAVGSDPREGHSPNVPDGAPRFKVSDGIHWTPMSDQPVIVDGLLDSQNVAFWDTVRGEYRDYHRNEFHIDKTGEEPYAAHRVRGEGGETLRGSRYGRDLRTATSTDFIHWSEPEYVNYTQGRTDEI